MTDKKTDYIQELIDWAKGGPEPNDSPLLQASKKLLIGAPKDFIQQMTGIMEFKESKLMRSNSVTITEMIDKIEVIYAGFEAKNKSNKSTLSSTKKPKKG